MLFAHDTERALLGAAALVNTYDPEDDTDSLATTDDLDRFVAEWEWTGARSGDAEELAAVQSLRPELRRLWELDAGDVAALVNEMLRVGGALPQLVDHDGWGYHLHATPADAPLAGRMAVEAAMAFVDVVRQGELGRLHVCEAPTCQDVMVDVSKNQSRRYCSLSCANRVNVAAYRARRRISD